MSAEIKPFIERRTQSRDLIHKLVDARTNMLSLYGKLAENHPFQKEEDLKNYYYLSFPNVSIGDPFVVIAWIPSQAENDKLFFY